MPPVFAAIGPILASIGGGSALAGAATLGTLGAAGVGIGEQISNATSGGGGPSQATQQQELLTQQEQAQKQQQQQLQQAFKQFAPDAQAQTGGSLSDSSFANLVQELSGQPGNIGTAQEAIFGTTPTPGLSS